MTCYSYCQHGGLFDQNPVKASKDLIPLKKGKSTDVYGGYNKAAATFFVFALSEELGKKKVKKELTLVPVNLMIADKFLKDDEFAVFSEAFRKKFYHLPGVHATSTRDAVIMAAGCIINCENIRQFRRNWLSLQNFFGASSIYNPKRTGDVDRMLFINSVTAPGIHGKYPGTRLIRGFMHSKLESYKFD